MNKKARDIEFWNNFYFFAILIAVLLLFFLKDFYDDGEDFLSVGQVHHQINVLPEDRAEEIISNRADLTIKAIKFRNFKLLQKFIHPNHGLRLSPYPYILSHDIVISPKKIAKVYHSNEKISWGVDENMMPINISLKEYYDHYIYDHDYANYDELRFNPNTKKKNVIDNTRQFFPKAIIVEYYVNQLDSDSPKKNWSILRLIFEEHKKEWYLSAIVSLKGSFSNYE